MPNLEMEGYKNNDQIANDESLFMEDEMATRRQQDPVVTSLSSYVKRSWEAARDEKQTWIEAEMLKVKRRLKGEYEPSVLAKIRAQGGSSVFMRLTDEKCEAAKAWLFDILLNEMPFDFKRSPVPMLPPPQKEMIAEEVKAKTEMVIVNGVYTLPSDIDQRIKMISAHIQKKMQEVANEAEAAIESKIKDVVVESNWKEALKGFISDLVDYKAGFLEGPIIRKKRIMAWDEQGNPQPTTKLMVTWDAPSPFDIYPLPASRKPEDGYIQKHTLKPRYIQSLKGAPGYDNDAIDLVLKDYGSGGLTKWTYETNQNEFDRLSYRQYPESDPEGTIDALQFKGQVQGLQLVQHGVSPERLGDLFESYDAEVWLIGRYVIKAVLNENPLGKYNLFKASFRERKDQWWGEGLPDLIEDSDRMCGAAARNIANNAGMITGPQVGVDTDAMAPGDTIKTITPLKIWQFKMKDVQSGTRAPIWFFQPKSMISELIKLYEFFSNEADNKSGIPKYSYGQKGGGGAINTATGFSMMMSNASRNIKKVVKSIDGVIEGSIEALHHYLLMTDPDPVLRMGDINLQATGSKSLINKEQAQIRRQEALQMVVHPAVLELIGREGFSEFMRQFFTGLDGSTADIVPSKEDILLQNIVAQNAPQSTGRGQITEGAKTNQAGDKVGGQDVRTA